MGDLASKLADLIPSLYYDVIARVAAGVPFVALLGLTGPGAPEGVPGFIVAGYITGLVLTPTGAPFGLVGTAAWIAYRRVFQSEPRKLLRLSRENDEVAAKSPDAGATLGKMQAEVTLCSNLAAAYVVLSLLRPQAMPLLGDSTTSRMMVGLVFAVAAAWRAFAYHERQARLYEIHVKAKPAAK